MFKHKKRQIIFLDLESEIAILDKILKKVLFGSVLFKKLWFEKRRKIRIFTLRARRCVLKLAGRPLRQGNSSMLKFAKEKWCITLNERAQIFFFNGKIGVW
jgi:hypothetical protein